MGTIEQNKKSRNSDQRVWDLSFKLAFQISGGKNGYSDVGINQWSF